MVNELPTGLTKEQAGEWFGTRTSGRFNPSGKIGQLWLDLGRYPTLEAIEEAGGTQYYRFADGTVIVRPEGGSPAVLTTGASAEQLAGWYGTATADGRDYVLQADHPVGQLWLTLGRFPRLETVANIGDGRYFRYADGTVIYRPTADTHGYRVLGENTTGGKYPDGMDKGLAEQWFRNGYNESGAVSKLWLKTGRERKRYPTYLGDVAAPDARFFRFADGSVFCRTSAGEQPTIFPVPVVPPFTTPPPTPADWPTAEAIDARIDRSSNNNNFRSPLTGMGNDFIALGHKYGINPAIVCAILQNETQLGTDGNFLATHFNNFGGNTADPDRGIEGNCGSQPHNGRFWKVFCSPKDGLEGVFDNLDRAIYRDTGGRWEEIMMIYTPPDDNPPGTWDNMWSTFVAVGDQLGVPIGKNTKIYAVS